MAKNNSKMVEAITPMDEDFAKWYTDIVKKAELIEYTSVKGCMVIRPLLMQSGKIFRKYLMECLKKPVMKMCACLCSFPKVFYRRKKIM